MNESIMQMLNKYNPQTHDDYKNALKEIIQELALLGLWRAKFFEKGAFYGGTALRILYGLDRFSEDLDFSLLKPTKNFDIGVYEKAIETELSSFGFQVSFLKKIKTKDSFIQSAFLKANTYYHYLQIDIPEKEKKKCHLTEQIKIKIEIDTNPPMNFNTELHYLLQPTAYAIKAYAKPDLFAGKVHALLYRTWKTRIKGRDWYDFIWFLKNKTFLNLNHLAYRIHQTHPLYAIKDITNEFIRKELIEKIKNLDIEAAKKDIYPFIKNTKDLEIWSKDFFLSLVDKIHFI